MATDRYPQSIYTPITRLLRVDYPILLAGMGKVSGPDLVAAVTNAGGLGVIGGVSYTPRILRILLRTLKSKLTDPNAPFGVDLLLPQVGEGARKTNYDYTKGQLDELIDVIIEEKAKLFVSAVGVPPIEVVQKLHDAGIFVMNMIGAPKHVNKCLKAGVDFICAQGTEGGGHTGDVATSILIPAAVDLCRGHVSPLTGEPVYVVGAGGIYDGRGLASALALGAKAVWIGTRFVASVEAAATPAHKQGVVESGYHDTYRSLVYSGRPLRIIKNDYATAWHARNREVENLLGEGVIPLTIDRDRAAALMRLDPSELSASDRALLNTMKDVYPHLCGQVGGSIRDVLPARIIVHNMIREAIEVLEFNAGKIVVVSKL